MWHKTDGKKEEIKRGGRALNYFILLNIFAWLVPGGISTILFDDVIQMGQKLSCKKQYPL